MASRARGLVLTIAAFFAATPALFTLTATGTASAATAGDAIVYLKSGKVWIAAADGSHAHAFTKAAYNWSSPSEDDNGDIVVVGGLQRTNADGTDSSGSDSIYRFAPNGNQIGKRIPTWGSYSTPSCPTYGPTSARVSPDGTKVAYGIWSCGDSDYTSMWTPTTSTGLNFPNQTLGQADYYQPAWIDSSTFVVSHVGPTVTDTQARWFAHATSDGDDVGSGWFDNNVTGSGAQGVISRGGTTFAVFEDDAASYVDGVPRNVRIWLYAASSLASAESTGWTPKCTVVLDASNVSDPLHLSPSISPDGTKLYWGDNTGIKVASIADLSADSAGNCTNVVPTLLIAGGSQPFASGGGIGTLVAEPLQPGAVYPPHPKFRVTTAHPHVNHYTYFDASASYETMGRIVSYVWHFGDNHTGSGRTTRHKFTKRGTFTVKLTVTDRRGVKRSVSHYVRVTRA